MKLWQVILGYAFIVTVMGVVVFGFVWWMSQLFSPESVELLGSDVRGIVDSFREGYGND